MQPDLLCGQNRFPAHLDTPTTVDVASGAVASVENGVPGITGTVDRANGLFDMEHDLNNLESAEVSRAGPSCSKLTTLLVNVSLKFQMLISQIH